jgi:DNA-binding response OmpR family regulator
MREKQILLAEDERDIAELLIFLLVTEGHWVEYARDGKVASEMLMERPWDLVLTDLMMPSLDGRELVQIIRESPQLAAIPVMMLSAVPESMALARCRPVDAFLQKPFRVEEFLSRVRRVLSR